MARKPADQSVHRDDIIQAAADVLKDQGYEATTMKDIAARVDLTAASLYHHFKNKDFLLLAVIELGLQHAIEIIEPIVQSDLSASEKLTQMIHTHINEITKNPAVGAALVFEIRSLMSVSTAGRGNGDTQEYVERRDQFFKQRDYFEKMFRETIKIGIADGEFRQVDAAIVAKSMLGAQNWVGVWYNAKGRLAGETIATIMADTFLTSLKK
ncbi:MAG: TetR/AcrR family transcriptional regulator [Phototrophicaceae bacterium]